MRLYRFIDAKYGLKSLTERRLKISRLDDQNDPFELFADSQVDRASRHRVREERRAIASEWGHAVLLQGLAEPGAVGNYADKHHGLCLGFDIDSGDAHQVEYIDERLPPDRLTAPSTNNTDPPDFARMKFEAWNYEAEYRVWCKLDPDGPKLQFAPFGARLQLAEVYLGARSKLTSAQVRAALNDTATDVEVVTTRIAFRTFAVVRQNAQSLQR